MRLVPNRSKIWRHVYGCSRIWRLLLIQIGDSLAWEELVRILTCSYSYFDVWEWLESLTPSSFNKHFTGATIFRILSLNGTEKLHPKRSVFQHNCLIILISCLFLRVCRFQANPLFSPKHVLISSTTLCPNTEEREIFFFSPKIEICEFFNINRLWGNVICCKTACVFFCWSVVKGSTRKSEGAMPIFLFT